MGLAVATVGLSTSLVCAQPATPILEYRFNEAGAQGTVVTAASTGSDTSAAATLQLSTKAPPGSADLHGPAGSGLTGKPADRALDLTSASAMGNQATGTHPVALTPLAATVDSIDQLQSFTLTGWYKTSDPAATLDRYAHLIDFRSGNSPALGFELQGQGRALNLIVNGGTAVASSAAYTDANKWVFFAVTYDGTQTANNVKFYRGYLSAADAGANPVFALVSTATLNKGTVAKNPGRLAIGNSDENIRPFKGFMDDVRFYGSKTDAQGALTEDQIGAIRASAMSEPAAAGTR